MLPLPVLATGAAAAARLLEWRGQRPRPLLALGAFNSAAYRRCRWLEALHLFAHLTFIPPCASVHVAALPREASNLRTLTARDSELRCH